MHTAQLCLRPCFNSYFLIRCPFEARVFAQWHKPALGFLPLSALYAQFRAHNHPFNPSSVPPSPLFLLQDSRAPSSSSSPNTQRPLLQSDAAATVGAMANRNLDVGPTTSPTGLTIPATFAYSIQLSATESSPLAPL